MSWYWLWTAGNAKIGNLCQQSIEWKKIVRINEDFIQFNEDYFLTKDDARILSKALDLFINDKFISKIIRKPLEKERSKEIAVWLSVLFDIIIWFAIKYQ